MKLKLTIAVAGLCLGLSAMGAGTGNAASGVGGVRAPDVSSPASANSMVQNVASRHYRYNRHTHGPRYRYRHRGYGYHHGGYWYATPWWLGAAAGAAIIGGIAAGSAAAANAAVGRNHVAWCEQRYRSYNPATNTFMGYDGLAHRCVSPY